MTKQPQFQPTAYTQIARVKGIVRHGDKRGRKLGYPTANMLLHQPLPAGVYSSLTKVRGVWKPSMTYIGANETFGGTVMRVETHIFDFRGNIYGEWLSVQLIRRVHGSKKFESVEKLIEVMQNDEVTIRKELAKSLNA